MTFAFHRVKRSSGTRYGAANLSLRRTFQNVSTVSGRRLSISISRLSCPPYRDPNAFEGRAVVFDGPEEYHHRIDDPSLRIDEHTMLFIRGVGAIGYPGSAEVVNMQPPAALIKRGITSLPCIGDGRQSGTSGSPSILNASPEAAVGGGLALLETGDRVRIDLNKGAANIMISDAELAQRRAGLEKRGGYRYPPSQTPWQEIQRGMVDQLADGMVLKPAVNRARESMRSLP